MLPAEVPALLVTLQAILSGYFVPPQNGKGEHALHDCRFDQPVRRNGRPT